MNRKSRAGVPPASVGEACGGIESLAEHGLGRRGTCLPCEPRIGTERGIYPAGTSVPQTRVGKSRCPFPNQPSCGLKVRAPIAVPGETINTYRNGGEGQGARIPPRIRGHALKRNKFRAPFKRAVRSEEHTS